MRFHLSFQGDRVQAGAPARASVRGPLSPKRVKKQAAKVFRFLFPSGYKGEVFLCGGAFKRLLVPGLSTNDLDLWVRNRKERDRLVKHLLDRGAKLERDFRPFCLRLDLEGCAVEITYHNIKNGSLSDIVHGFDIAGCAIGASYRKGKVNSVYISPGAQETLIRREVVLEQAYLDTLATQRLPTVLRGIDRIQRFALETGFRIRDCDMDALWDLYFEHYSAEEKQQCLDVYLETTVGFKQACDKTLLQRATAA